MLSLVLTAAIALTGATPSPKVVNGEQVKQVQVLKQDQESLVVVASDHMKKDGDKVSATFAAYLPKALQMGDGKHIDFIVTFETFDCSKTNAFTVNALEGYDVDVQPPVFTTGFGETWIVADAKSLSETKWEMACKGIRNYPVIKDFQLHEDILYRYRKDPSFTP